MSLSLSPGAGVRRAITPVPGVEGLGAELVATLPRCRPVYAAGPGYGTWSMSLVQTAWPLVTGDEFVGWSGAKKEA